MTTTTKCQISMTQLLMPMCMMALTLSLLFGFQMSQIMRDREALEQSKVQQEKPLEEAQKIHSQFGGLIMMTRQFAEEGSESAKMLVGQLSQIGIIPPAQPKPQAIPTIPAPPVAPDAPIKP